MMAAMIFMAEIPPVVQPCSETNQLAFKQFKNVTWTQYYFRKKWIGPIHTPGGDFGETERK